MPQVLAMAPMESRERQGQRQFKGKDRGSFGGEWANGWVFGRGRGRERTNKAKEKEKSPNERKVLEEEEMPRARP